MLCRRATPEQHDSVQVLVAGSEVTLEYKIQVYTPPYLLGNNSRPVIGQAPANVTWGRRYQVSWSGAPSIDRVVLQKLADSTHSIAWDLRQVSTPPCVDAYWTHVCMEAPQASCV